MPRQAEIWFKIMTIAGTKSQVRNRRYEIAGTKSQVRKGVKRNKKTKNERLATKSMYH